MLFPSENARDTADCETPAKRATSVEEGYLLLDFMMGGNATGSMTRRPVHLLVRLQHPPVDEVCRTDRVASPPGAKEDEEIRHFLRRREAADGGVFLGEGVEIALPVATLVGSELFR